VYTQVIESPLFLKLPHPNPPLAKATVYTQVIESPLFLKLPHPNPPLAKGRELIFRFPPQSIGEIKGGNLTCVYTIAS
jgi:hypothetical protein